MSTVVLALRMTLAAVFLTAALAKLLDLPGSRRALTDFGVPASLARSAGTLLPLAELAIAGALVLQPSARWAAIASLVLLLAFIAGIANALRKGQTPDCHCFGTIRSEPAGRGLLVRNGLLAAGALVAVAWGPGAAVDAWVADRSGAELAAVALGICTLALVGATVALWRANRRLRAELVTALENAPAAPGLKLGAPAPEFRIPSADGTPVTLAALRARGRPIALVFVGPGCGPCATLLPDLEVWRETVADELTIGLVGTGVIADFDTASSRHGSGNDALAHEPGLEQEVDTLYALFADYGLKATPSAVIVSPDGVIASATVDGRPAIEALIRAALADRGPAARLLASSA